MGNINELNRHPFSDSDSDVKFYSHHIQKQKLGLTFMEVHTLNPKGLFFLYTKDSLSLICFCSITYEAVYLKTLTQGYKWGSMDKEEMKKKRVVIKN